MYSVYRLLTFLLENVAEINSLCQKIEKLKFRVKTSHVNSVFDRLLHKTIWAKALSKCTQVFGLFCRAALTVSFTSLWCLRISEPVLCCICIRQDCFECRQWLATAAMFLPNCGCVAGRYAAEMRRATRYRPTLLRNTENSAGI